MTTSTTALEVYITGLRNQHAAETQAIGTLQNEMSYTTSFPELHARMAKDKAQSITQAARLDELLAKHDTAKSLGKEVVAGAVATLSGFAHVAAKDDVLKNVLAAIGFKAYEIGSYKALTALAELAGAAGDKAVLEQSMREEQEMGDWLGEHLPSIVQAYISKQGA